MNHETATLRGFDECRNETLHNAVSVNVAIRLLMRCPATEIKGRQKNKKAHLAYAICT